MDKKLFFYEPKGIVIDELGSLDLYHLFRIRDCLKMLAEYGLADENLLDEVNRIIETKTNQII